MSNNLSSKSLEPDSTASVTHCRMMHASTPSMINYRASCTEHHLQYTRTRHIITDSIDAVDNAALIRQIKLYLVYFSQNASHVIVLLLFS